MSVVEFSLGRELLGERHEIVNRINETRSARTHGAAAKSYAFQQEREAHAAANTQRGETQPGLSLLHLVDERGRDANSGTTDGMAQSDRATVHI